MSVVSVAKIMFFKTKTIAFVFASEIYLKTCYYPFVTQFCYIAIKINLIDNNFALFLKQLF